MGVAMGRMEMRHEGEGLRYYLDGEPVEAGTPLEILTLWGWRKGAFVPGNPPSLQSYGQAIPIEHDDQIRRA